MKQGRNPLPAVLLATFISGFGFSVVVPVSSVVLEELHVATPIIGLVATIMFAGFAVGGPLSGRCIRLYGIRSTVAAGLVGVGPDAGAHRPEGMAAALVCAALYSGHCSRNRFYLR